MSARGMHRRGVSLVEVLVGITVLVVGLLPLFDVFSCSRTRVGVSRDMLLLQSNALQLLSEGRARVASGELQTLGTVGEEVLEVERDGIRTNLKISRVAGGRVLMLFVRAEKGERYYETYQVAADPFTSFELEVEEEDA